MKPILTVHGYADSYKMPWWNKMIDQLRSKEVPDNMVRRVDLGDPLTTIDSPKKYARDVRDSALDLHEKTGEQLSIISHSMGGIDSRYFVEVLNGHEVVDNLITIGSPHKGTRMARLGFFSPGGQDMTVDSTLIDEINRTKLPKSVTYTAIWGSDDFLIYPKTNARLPEDIMKDEDTNLRIEDVGHLELLFSKEIFEEYYEDLLKCKLDI